MSKKGLALLTDKQAAAVTKVPRRDEIAAQYQWRLEDIFNDVAEWEQEFQKAKEAIEHADAYKGKVTESGETLLAAFQLQERIEQSLLRVYAYAAMLRDQESTNSEAQAMMQRALSLWSQAQTGLAYITPEILEADPEVIRGYVQQVEGLRVYAHALDDILRTKPHVLSVQEEQILAQVGDLARGIETAFEMLNEADMKFGTVKDEEGREVELSHARYIQFLRSKDRRVRQDAFETFHIPYERSKNTFGALYSNSVTADAFYARVRRYESALHAALSADNVPQDVYDNLIETVRAHLPLVQRYFALRKQMLGVDELKLYDLYVPLVSDVEIKFSYEESCRLVKEALRPLGDGYQEALDRCFKDRWIDVYENQGKVSGAYMRDVYGVHPYILMNYQGTINDLFTLAHELGHAIHSYFTHRAQPFVYASHSIFIAEVASMFNEAMLLSHLLDVEQDPRRRLYYINQALDDYIGTVYRQTMFAEFEKEAHATVESGGALTSQSLSELYGKLLRDYHEPQVVIDPRAELGWARIPHFYSAFYVYKYATGFSAANALAQAVLQNQAGAVDRYLAFLSAGSSDYPLNLLKEAGVDMTTPKPIADTLAVFSRLLDELEQLKG